MDIISEQAISALVRGEIGKEITLYDVVGSTNDLAKQQAQAGKAHGSVMIAREQVAGRGRMGRTFYSPGTGLYMSLILRPQMPVKQSLLLTSAVAVAAARAIEKTTALEAQIKWVNDLYIHGKKLGGILVESALKTDGGLAFAVVGIGINVYTKNLPPELSDKMTSLALAGGNADMSINCLAAEILNELDILYASGLENRLFLQEYRSRSCVLGKQVMMLWNGQEELVRVKDITEDAGLVVEKANGEHMVLSSGEISLRGDFV